MKRVKPEDWQPADDMTLERTAMNIARRSNNKLVVAGPGAGKTELLAQKACFFCKRIPAAFLTRSWPSALKEMLRII